MLRARQIILTFIYLLVTGGLSACTPRGPLALVPDGTPPGETVTVFQASNRAYGPLDEPRLGRSLENSYDRYDIRIPEKRQPGSVPITARSVRVDQQFLVADKLSLGDESALIRSLQRELSRLPVGEREISVFAPGFNMSAAQSLARTAQLKFDLDISGVAALFSWPSAASVLGYAYDRDSALYSRDSYERFLRALAKSRPERLILVAHSMGSLLTMETLRQIAINDPSWIRSHVGGVVLISPDIDLDVFRSQVARIGKLPQPFVIFVSEKDRALALSSRISGDTLRLGAVTDPALVGDMEVTLIDISLFNSVIGHFDVGRSPALLTIISQMAAVEESFEDDPASRVDPLTGTILSVRNASEIILLPVSR